MSFHKYDILVKVCSSNSYMSLAPQQQPLWRLKEQSQSHLSQTKGSWLTAVCESKRKRRNRMGLLLYVTSNWHFWVYEEETYSICRFLLETWCNCFKIDLRAASLSKSVTVAWDTTRPQRNSDANRKDTCSTAIYRKEMQHSEVN